VAETKSKRTTSAKRSGGKSKSSGSTKRSGGKSKSSGSTKRSGGKSKSSGSTTRRRSSQRDDRPMREVVMEAVGQVQELIGRPVESVTGVEKNGNEWTVMVEVLELERIPNTTDVLGIYEVTLDKDGELTAAHRTRRFYRSEAGED
jgi:gas vesicle protein GvpO